jgi:hypothetical protein
METYASFRRIIEDRSLVFLPLPNGCVVEPRIRKNSTGSQSGTELIE